MCFKSFVFYIFTLSVFQSVRGDVFWQQPEQVHLAYGKNISEIVVTWSTFNKTDSSVVEYGIGGLILKQVGTSKLFIDGGPRKHSQYIHTVTLKHLTPDSKYGKKICLISMEIRSLNEMCYFQNIAKLYF